MTNPLKFGMNVTNYIANGHSMGAICLDFEKVLENVPNSRISTNHITIAVFVKTWPKHTEVRVVLNGKNQNGAL